MKNPIKLKKIKYQSTYQRIMSDPKRFEHFKNSYLVFLMNECDLEIKAAMKAMKKSDWIILLKDTVGK